MEPGREVEKLIDIVSAIRTPGSGCIWSLQQDFGTTISYTLEEVRELKEAVSKGAVEEIRDELGDLLYHVVFFARIAEERGAFDFGDIVDATTKKLIRRHPHVFGGEYASTPEEVDRIWARVKDQEKAEREARRNFGTGEE